MIEAKLGVTLEGEAGAQKAGDLRKANVFPQSLCKEPAEAPSLHPSETDVGLLTS